MKTEVSFHSTAFNCGADSSQSAEDTCLGKDVCRWLMRRLREQGIQTADELQQGNYCWSVTFHVAETGHVFSTRFWPNDRAAGDHWHCWVERQRGFITSLLGGRKRGIRPEAIQALDAAFSSSPDICLLEWHEPSKAKKIAEVICPTCGIRVVAYRTIGGRILVTSGAGIVLAIVGGVIGAAIGLATGGEAMPATIPGVAIGFVVGCGYGYVTSDKTLDRPKCPNCKQPINLGFR